MKMKVLRYTFVDYCKAIYPEDQGFLYDFSLVAQEDSYKDFENHSTSVPKWLDAVGRAFKKSGWEGDGKIGLIWIPPFMFNDGNTEGSFVWHVKQGNNGISFIGLVEGTSAFDLHPAYGNNIFLRSLEDESETHAINKNAEKEIDVYELF